MADWEKRRAAIATVRYRIAGTRLWTRGAFNEELGEDVPGPVDENPDTDVKGTFTRTILLDFPRNRHRIEWDDVSYGNLTRQLYRVRDTHVCDGQTLFSRIHENTYPGLGSRQAKKHVDMIIFRGKIPIGIFDDTYLPLFLGHGVVTYNEVRVRAGLLAPKAIATDFIYRGRRVHDGRPCAIFRTIKRRATESEFWIDLERDSAVVKTFDNPDSLVAASTTEIKYQKTQHGWLVKSWTLSYAGYESFKVTTHMRVEEIKERVPVGDSDFSVEITPGLFIEEQDTTKHGGESRYYKIEANGQKTELNAKLFPIAPAGR